MKTQYFKRGDKRNGLIFYFFLYLNYKKNGQFELIYNIV